MYKACFLIILLLLSGCKKNKNRYQDALDKSVSIEANYPADYFTVPLQFPEEKTKESVVYIKAKEDVLKEIKAEKEFEKKTKEDLKKELLLEKEREKKEQELLAKSSVKNYIARRANVIRAIRQELGADILMSKASKFENMFEPDKPEWVMSQKEYENTPNIESSFPVDRSFILTEDRSINVVLVDSVNTQIPGTVRAFATEDVFGANNRNKLIEKGDVFIGKYESLSKIGDSRVEILFYRILRSDGAQIYLSGKAFAYAADKMGRTGLIGDVDNRNWERYGAAVITAGIGGLAGVAKSKTSGDTYEEFFSRLGDNTVQVTSKILEKTMNLAPVVTIAQGEPFVVRLATDITLKRPIEKEKEQ